MALSFRAVEAAYKVFNKLKVEHIPSWPEDMATWTKEEQKNPPVNTVLGWDKKSDSGWESIVFFVKDPSDHLRSSFDELKNTVPNSSISKPYHRNPSLWVFGWF